MFVPVPPVLAKQSNLTLIDPGEKPVPYQWVPADQSPNGKPVIAFQANVTEFGKCTYQLVNGTPVKVTDLAVKNSAGYTSS